MARLNHIDILEKLVGFESISRTSNLDLIDFIRNYLSDFGVKSVLAFNQDHDRANLFATIGPDDRGGVMLSGHTDVVPVYWLVCPRCWISHCKRRFIWLFHMMRKLAVWALRI